MAGGTKNFMNTSLSMQIFLLPMLLSVLKWLQTLSCGNKLYLHLPNILGLLMLECYLETKVFSLFLSLKLNQTSDQLFLLIHTPANSLQNLCLYAFFQIGNSHVPP